LNDSTCPENGGKSRRRRISLIHLNLNISGIFRHF